MEAVVTWGAIPYGEISNGRPEKAVSERQHKETATLTSVVLERQDGQQMSDEQLMSQVRTGDSHALEQLYERHVRGCFGLAMKIVRDPSVAEEVVQDVFMKLWSNPDRFSPDKGKFSSWLLTLVHNRSVDKLRRAKSYGNSSTVTLDSDFGPGVRLVDALPDGAPSPYEDAWNNEKGRIVRAALMRLPEVQQQTIALAYFGGLTQKEIAEQLDEPLGTIKTRTRSALLQLRRALGQQDLLGELR